MLAKRTKRAVRITAITLCIVAVIVAATMLYVYFSQKEVTTNGVPYKEIAENTALPTKQYDNLDLSKAFLHIPQADEFYEYYRIGQDYANYTPDECAKQAQSIYTAAFDVKGSDNIVYCDGDNIPIPGDQAWDDVFHESYSYPTYPDGHKGFAGFSDTGTFLMSANIEYDTVDAQVVEYINLDSGEQLPDKAYELADGQTYKMQDALELANATVEKIKEFLPTAELRATKFLVLYCYRLDKETAEKIYYYQYQTEYEYLLDGVPFTDSYPANFKRIESLYDVFCDQLRVNIAEAGKPGTIENSGSLNIQGKEPQPLKDEFLTLDSACALLSDYLAPNYIQHINEVTVKYAIPYDATADHTDERLHARPCWCFIIDDGFSSTNTFTCEKQMLVDMQTGDIFALVGDVYESTTEHENDISIFEKKLNEISGKE